MAELVDALDSKSSSARSAGSIPARGTTLRPCGLRVAQPRKTSKGEACPAKLERSESKDGFAQVKTGCRKFSDSTVKEPFWRRHPARPGDPVFQRRFVLMRDVTAYWMPRLKRGMTAEEYNSAFPRRDAPESCKNFCPRKAEGAGKAGCPVHPQPRVWCRKHAR